MASWIIKHKHLVLWLAVTGGLGWWLSWVLFEAEDKTVLLPGITTDGHHQIEMECHACHTNEEKENIFTSSGVTNESCIACHGEELEQASDSHPIRKFRNPENAIFLEHIDAMNCITCHREHNEKITNPMAVTVPGDYCAHCHEVTLENLESHRDLSFKSCATAGCHNYHDNTALAPSFLLKNYGKPEHLPERILPATNPLTRWMDQGHEPRKPLREKDADAPVQHQTDSQITADWHSTAHARAGINCRDCHGVPATGDWVTKPDHTSCAACHEHEVDGFLQGKHGMRLAHKRLGPMTPASARLPMRPDAPHAGLSCNSCHEPHRYDRQFAAQEACIKCHDDAHTRHYENSPHHNLWKLELTGDLPAGSGVSCATCHLPREEHGGAIIVNHNQNANLRPNEKMLRNTCMTCHSQQFAMDALADPHLIERNFTGRPTTRHPGIGWTVESAIKRGDEDIIKLQRYLESLSNTPQSN